MENVKPPVVMDHPLIQHKLSLLRDKTTNVRDFRALCTEITMLMAFEAMRDLPLEDAEIESGLKVIGYGEISTVLAMTSGSQTFACKRLPLFSSKERAEYFAALFGEYIGALNERGIDVIDSRLQLMEGADGAQIVYCVQPLLDGSGLGPVIFARLDADKRNALFADIVTRVKGCVDAKIGVDGQLSNWAVVDDRPVYIDITTPMMRDAEGNERLDWGVHLAALPWLLRAPVRWFLLKSLTSAYYDPRLIVVDFLANLYKENMGDHVEELAGIASDILGQSVTERDAAKYYRSNARTYAFLLRVRRMDRTWQRRVRRRPYPFLLPGPIER